MPVERVQGKGAVVGTIVRKRSRRLVACGVAGSLLWLPVQCYAQVSPTDEYSKLITAARNMAALGTHPFGERINPYDGNLSFDVTDIRVPGTGPTLQLSRSFEVGSSGLYTNLNRQLPFGDWDLDIPRIETYAADQANVTGWQVGNSGNVSRCTDFNTPPPVASSQGGDTWSPNEWWYGYHLIVPGWGDQILLARGTANTHTPASGSFQIVTKRDWMIACGVTASDGGEGFEPPRLSRRLQPLRGLEHEHREAVLT